MYTRYLISSAFLASSLLFSCSGSTDNNKQVTTANNVTLSLRVGEKNLPLDQLDKFSFARYDRYLNTGIVFQVPLNKAIFSRNQSYFVGIPIDGSVYSLYESYALQHRAITLAAELSTDTTIGKIFAKDSAHFILIEIVKTKENKILVGGLFGKDSTQIASYYTTGNTTARLSNDTNK
jgi:hypothetical protein